MHITNKLQEYVNDSMKFCQSNVLITDLKEIKLSEILSKDKNNINISCNLHIDVLNIIEKLKHLVFAENNDVHYMFNEKCIKLCVNDCNSYKSQMIFPLIEKDKLIGLIIFFRMDRDYVKSSVHSVSSFIHFVNEFILEGD